MLGSFVIANYITVTTDLEISIHIGNGHNLFVKLSQEIHNTMPKFSPKETMLMTANIL